MQNHPSTYITWVADASKMALVNVQHLKGDFS